MFRDKRASGAGGLVVHPGKVTVSLLHDKVGVFQRWGKRVIVHRHGGACTRCEGWCFLIPDRCSNASVLRRFCSGERAGEA